MVVTGVPVRAEFDTAFDGVTARVYLIEDLVDTTIVDLDVGGQIVKLRTDQRPDVREGDNVHMAFAECHLFERDSGARRGE